MYTASAATLEALQEAGVSYIFANLAATIQKFTSVYAHLFASVGAALTQWLRS
jgi:hypothetical protein